MPVNGKNKGANYERHIAGLLREYGYDTRRGYVFYHEPDVVGLPGLHLELKKREKMELYKWLEQSTRDAKSDEIPIVIHAKNHCDSLVSLRLSDFMTIYREWEAGRNDR